MSNSTYEDIKKILKENLNLTDTIYKILNIEENDEN